MSASDHNWTPAGRSGQGAGAVGDMVALRDGLKLPHSVEAEREILSAVFVDANVMDTLIELIQADDFYLERHQLVFEAMETLHQQNGAIDPVTVKQTLRDRGHWERIGAAQGISELLDRVGTSAHAEHYARIVSSKALVRRMMDAARTIETRGHQEIEDVEAFLDEAERSVFSVLEDRGGASLRPVSEAMAEAIRQIEAAFGAEGDITGVGTGFRDFDRITHGLQPGDLVIVAARPSMGKTAFVLNLAANAALRHDSTVALFSLEMPSEQLAQRLLSAEARIDLGRLRGGYVGDDEWPRLTEAADRIARASLFMDDTPGITPMNVRAQCRRLKRRDGLDLVIIDYLQLMSGGGGRNQRSREQEISSISRSLKGLAKDIGAPVVALSQLNRGLESRQDKRPMMSDLRESGAIEQDADIICFIYRDEVYKKEATEESERGVAELIIAKHRNGSIGTVKLKFWQAYTRFDNLALDAMR